ncbi:hypothetical protein KY326_02405 [Candidatus Woesearchaeota archaeon]|nr:hypothetical protein [Candidatus Woesearchaeota archaeon]
MIIGILVILLIVGIASAQTLRTFEVDEGDLVKLKLDARDPDGDEITYQFEPPLDVNGEWLTSYDSAGEYNIKVTATDSRGEETSETVKIIVNDVNVPPTIPSAEITINEGELLELPLPEYDFDGDKISYSIDSMTDEDGKWQTDYNDAGQYEIIVTSRDGRYTKDGKPASSRALFLVTVNNVDQLPEVENIEKSIFEGERVRLKFPDEDPDEEVIEYIIENLPEGAVFEDNEFEWTPDYNLITEKDAAIYIVSYRIPLKKRSFSEAKMFLIPVIAKTESAETQFNITIYVKNKNRAPIIGGIDDKITIQETEQLVLDADISDPDEDPLEISYFMGETKLKSNKFITDYDSEGKYTITIEASDGNLTTAKEVEIIVENKNRPPYLKTDKVVVNEGEKVTILVEANDDDNDTVGIKAIELPEKVDYDRRESVIEFEPKFNFVLHDDNYTANFFDYALNKVFGTKRFQKWLFTTFELDDGIDEVERNFTIIVKDVNRAPVLEDIQSRIKVREGEELFIPLKGYDPDGDELTYKFKGLVNKNNATIDYDKEGEYNLTIIVTDGQLKASTSVRIEVIDMNRPPEMRLKTASIKEGETLYLPLKAKDYDGDKVTFEIEEAPEDAYIDNDTLIWTAPYHTVQHYVIDENKQKIRNPLNYNELLFVVVASDNDYDTIVNTTIRIYDVNQPPVIKDWYPATRFRIKQGEKMEFFVNAEDPDGDELTYTWYPTRFRKILDDNVHVRKMLTLGLRDFKVVVSDGELEAENAWQFYVRK